MADYGTARAGRICNAAAWRVAAQLPPRRVAGRPGHAALRELAADAHRRAFARQLRAIRWYPVASPAPRGGPRLVLLRRHELPEGADGDAVAAAASRPAEAADSAPARGNDDPAPGPLRRRALC